MLTKDNVVKMPAALERRAQNIELALERQRKAEDDGNKASDDWRAATLDLAVELKAAKDELPALQDFGKWCAGKFGDNALPYNERAALIRWGADPEGTRAMLAKTDSRSIRVIDGRFHSPVKTATTPKREQAEASIREHKARTGSYPSVIEAGKESGLSRIVIEPALAAVKAEDSVAPSEIRFTKAQDAHVEARIKALRKALEAEHSERVRLGVLESNADYLAALNQLQKEASEKWERYDSLINSHKPIFTDTEFTIILTCLHPDNSASPEKRDNAFKAFNAMKLQLTGKK